jgi:soluble lytic murein transglycosylase-like protein/outer membrane protein assembly factor BamD (BamD/ComL family)
MIDWWNAVQGRARFFISLICLIVGSQPVHGEPNEEQLTLDVISDLHLDQRHRKIELVEKLQKAYNFPKSTYEKKLAALSLSSQYSDSNPRLALQYLTSAEHHASQGDPLEHIIKFYRAKIKLNLGVYDEAHKIAEDLYANEQAKEWRDKVIPLLIEALFQNKQYDKVFSLYQRYSKKNVLSRRQEEIIKFVAMSFEKTKNEEKAYQILEDLSRNYPLTEHSRWAFTRLLDLQCDKVTGKRKHYFSKDLLVRLSRNTELETGLEQFLKESISGPIRLAKNRVEYLDEYEQVRLLFRMRFYEDSLVSARKLLELESIKSDRGMLQKLKMLVGRIYLRLNDPAYAARYFSELLHEFPNSHLKYRVREYLGDSLSHLGYFDEAANQFSLATRDRRARRNGWREFWHLYRSNKFSEALQVLQVKNHVKSMEPRHKESVKYWEGKILTKLGKVSEAREIFQTILEKKGEGFYAQLIAAQYPSLLKKRPSMVNAPVSSSNGFRLAAKLVTGEPIATGTKSAELKQVEDLIEFGMEDHAKLMLQGLRWSNYYQENAYAALSRLAWMVEDYRPAGAIGRRSFSAMNSAPSDWWSIKDHQEKHAAEWRLYFPIAYERIVGRVSDQVNTNKFFVLSIMRAESRYKKDAKSWVGARGLMQIMPYTGIKIARLLSANDFDVADLSSPETNVSYGAYYLDRLLNYYGGNKFVAAAAYNAGPGAVGRWLEHCKGCTTDEFVETISYRETRRYVKKVMSYFAQYQRIYEGKSSLRGLPSLPLQLPEGVEIF